LVDEEILGKDHIRRITQALSGACVAAVTDIDPARAQKIAKGLGGRAETTGQDLIAAKDVDAEIDAMRWLLDDEYVSAQVLFPKKTSKASQHLADPL
jgi:hypothetical protein